MVLEGEGVLVLKDQEAEAVPVAYRLRFAPRLGSSGVFRGSGILTPLRLEGTTDDPQMVALLRRVGRKATLRLADGRSARVLLTSSDGSSFGVAVDGQLLNRTGKPVDPTAV